MLTDVARRIANCDEITSERLEAVLIYLRKKLAREKEEDLAISLITVKSERMIDESLRIRASTTNLEQDAG